MPPPRRNDAGGVSLRGAFIENDAGGNKRNNNFFVETLLAGDVFKDITVHSERAFVVNIFGL